jgi:hypothetical protein
MKTIKKTIMLGLAIGISTYSFSQLNLGVSSATQAAVKTTANTTAITRTTTAATQGAGTSVKAASTSALDAKIKAAAIVDAKSTGAVSAVVGAKENALNNTNASANAGIAVSSQNSTVASQNSTVASVGNSAAQTALSGETAVNAHADLNGKTVIDQTETRTNKLATALENKTEAKAQSATTVKMNSQSDLPSKLETVKERTIVQPSVKTETKAETKITTAAAANQ